MRKITIDTHAYEVPGSWDEMTTGQLEFLIRLTLSPLSIYEIQLKFFLYCISGRVKHSFGAGLHGVKTGQSYHLLYSSELAAVLEVFDYLFKEQDGQKYISPKLTVNHYPRIRSGIKSLVGPEDMLQNISYNQFVFLQTHQAQISDEDPGTVDEFVNVLYKTRSGKQNVKNIRRVRKEIKTAVLWMYLGTLSFLEEKFPHVFSGGGSETGNVFDSQQRIIDMMAGGDVTKKDRVRESLLFDAMYSMEMAAIRMEEMEKQNRK